MADIAKLFEDHIKQITERTNNMLSALNYDGLILGSGTAFLYFEDDMISSVIAFAGLVLLTDPLSQNGIQIGDLWTIIAALGFSIQIHLLQIFMKKYNATGPIAFLQVFFIGVFSALCFPYVMYHNTTFNFLPTTGSAIFAFLYLAMFATTVTTWLQARYQKDTTPERAAVIYVLEPLFACLFGYLILKEVMTGVSLIGACLMICAILWGMIAKIMRGVRTKSSKT